jgi:pantoate--beta-alanine ligase
MEIFHHSCDMQAWALRQDSIAFVPTMGALHEGHLSLVDAAHSKAGKVVVSIFVNPTQFTDPKDFEKYPRNIQDDFSKLKSAGVDAVLCPQVEDMYRTASQTWVEVSNLAQRWEGTFRPGHFRGVATVVLKLFQIVQPRFAIFGEKDFQQVRIIEQMVADLFCPIEIVRGEIFRESSGLAMSSRNIRLTAEEHRQALGISRGLFQAVKAVQQGERKSIQLENIVRAEIEKGSLAKIDYIASVCEKNLEPISRLSDEATRLLVAVQYPSVRLIDNIALVI